MNAIIKKLGAGAYDKLTVPVKKEKEFTHIKDNIPHRPGLNFMADLLELPKTKDDYRYLFVITDLWSNVFDIEPLKSKTATVVLEALKKIIGRKIIKKPYASLQTDAGTEFKGPFHKWLYDNSILHRVTFPNRHTQQSAVESLNKQIVGILFAYLNKKEKDLRRRYLEWTDILDFVRKELNAMRRNDDVNDEYPIPTITKINKFKVGDLVHRKLDVPQDALGHDQSTKNFRVGDYRYDKIPIRITKVLLLNGPIPFRYMLDGIPNASFTEKQLMLSDAKQSVYKIKDIIGRKKLNGKYYYLVHWKGYLKRDSTWEPIDKLIVDGCQQLITDYDKKYKGG